jgi:hypothetical protein
MVVVSILVTGGLTATATTDVPISSPSRTREAQILRQARAPACPPQSARVNNGHARHPSLSTRRSALALASLLIGARSSKLAMRVRFPSPHTAHLSARHPAPAIGPAGSTTSTAERCHSLEPVRTTTAGATGTRWENVP